MTWPLKATISTPAGEVKVVGWEVVRSETTLTRDEAGGRAQQITRDELRITCPKSPLLGHGTKVTLDTGGVWIVDGAPHEVRGGWWKPGLVTYTAVKETAR